jgi:urease accessory protein
MRRAAQALAAVLTALGCSSARAHLETTGMGPVYDGLMHFLTSPEDLVSALALALLAGLHGVAHGRRAVLVLPAAWLVGCLCGLNAAASATGALGTAFALLVLGALVVTDVKLSLWALSALAALLGLLHGYFNGSGMGVSVASIAAALGVAAAVFVLVVLVAAFVATLRAQWARIAVRVGGSWIAASGLLLLGWSVRAALA